LLLVKFCYNNAQHFFTLIFSFYINYDYNSRYIFKVFIEFFISFIKDFVKYFKKIHETLHQILVFAQIKYKENHDVYIKNLSNFKMRNLI